MKISYGYEEIYRGNSIGQLTHERCTTSSLVIWELETKTTVKLHTHSTEKKFKVCHYPRIGKGIEQLELIQSAWNRHFREENSHFRKVL